MLDGDCRNSMHGEMKAPPDTPPESRGSALDVMRECTLQAACLSWGRVRSSRRTVGRNIQSSARPTDPTVNKLGSSDGIARVEYLLHHRHMKQMHKTRNSLPQATRARVEVILNQSLADLNDLYSQTKQAHWNVRGPHFYSLHKLFDDLADSVEAHIDPLAERIVALGGVANGTVRQAAARSALTEFPTERGEGLAYVTALVERFAQCGAAARKGIEDTAAIGDADTADMLTGLSQDLDKSLWMLEAHTKP